MSKFIKLPSGLIVPSRVAGLSRRGLILGLGGAIVASKEARAGFLLNSFNATPPPAFSYRAAYTDTVDAATFTFASCDLGTAHGSRLIVVGITVGGGTANFASTVTVAGISATLAVTSGTASRHAELWYALVPTGATGDVVVTFPASVARCAIGVWAGYPGSSTPVDALGNSVASSTTVLLTDLAKTNGGFACFVTRSSNSTTTMAVTGTGAETITENADAIIEAANHYGFASFIVTATTTADDYTATFSVSSNIGFVGATWV